MNLFKLLFEVPTVTASAGINAITISVFFYIAIAVVLVLLSACMAMNMKKAVDRKGYDAKALHIFAWCFWFPLFGYLYAIALPDLRVQKQNEEIIRLLNSNADKKDTRG